MTRITKVPTVGAVTPSDTHLGSGLPPTVVGDPPQWNDESDATYAELEVFEHPDVSYTDAGTADLGKARTATNPATTDVFVRIRYQALATDMRLPRARVDRVGAPPDLTYALTAPGVQPYGASMTPAWHEILLEEGFPDAKRRVLEELQLGRPETLLLHILPEYLSTIAFRTPRMRIFEAHLIVSGPGTDAPPARLFPREDGLGVGSGRLYPPPKSQQRSSRIFGYY